MKNLTEKKTLIMALLFGLAISPIAVSFDEIDDPTIYESETLPIDGQYSGVQRAKQSRQKLEKQVENMVGKKIEAIRTRAERKLNRDLRNAFAGEFGLGELSSGSSTSTTKKETPIVVVKPKSSFVKGKNKVAVYVGVPQLDGKNTRGFNPQAGAALDFETRLTKRLAFTLGLNYSSFQEKGSYCDSYSCNTYYDDSYTLSANTMGVDVALKAYISGNSRINPYFSIGAGYSRSSLTYHHENAYHNGRYIGYHPFYGNAYYNDNHYDDASVSLGSARVSAAIGSDVLFSREIGLSIKASYSKNVSGGIRDDNKYTANEAEDRLNDIAKDLHDAGHIFLGLGLFFRF